MAPKNQHHPSRRVENSVASVPQSSSGRWVVIVPAVGPIAVDVAGPRRRQEPPLSHQP
jgi:hypothetical protein